MDGPVDSRTTYDISWLSAPTREVSGQRYWGTEQGALFAVGFVVIQVPGRLQQTLRLRHAGTHGTLAFGEKRKI